ncbi:ABC transporter ATP-binding protein [Paenibacillus lautus]|uniref:ABC transporter ATP-binding protein n=1 Tax=Paenibacillus lautus TaxID=1401 RepID=UPI00384BA025|nr:ABC transporter ATP-binding protein [Cytobacillus firmus]
MKKKSAISFLNVSKTYKIFKNRPTTLKEKIINTILRRNHLEVIKVNVLKDVSFDIYEGETVGIIGRNGAGKSTSLKMIAKIINPDKGAIKVRGSVSSLLEIGAGFQPDLTGRENVFLYGSILGLSKKYIKEHYSEIVDFSELNDFMNTPVKNYSSGMYMRLAFSVAIHVNPDILLLDEVLAVGDANFQKKCMSKLREIQDRGKTIVFVSHDMASVKMLCDKIIYIGSDGELEVGDTDLLVNRYYTHLYGNNTETKNTDKISDFINGSEFFKHTSSYFNQHDSVWGNRKIEVQKFYFSNEEGHVTNIFQHKNDIVINIELKSLTPQEKIVVGIAIYNENGVLLSGPNSKQNGVIMESIHGSEYVKIIMKDPPFLSGRFYLTLAIYDYDCIDPFFHMEKCFEFIMVNERNEVGTIGVNCEWLM